MNSKLLINAFNNNFCQAVSEKHRLRIEDRAGGKIQTADF